MICINYDVKEYQTLIHIETEVLYAVPMRRHKKALIKRNFKTVYPLEVIRLVSKIGTNIMELSSITEEVDYWLLEEIRVAPIKAHIMDLFPAKKADA